MRGARFFNGVKDMDLIREHIPMPLMRGIKTVMFCAHDEQEHAVRWSEFDRRWVLENQTGERTTFHGMLSALSALFQATAIASTEWTITDNPYI